MLEYNLQFFAKDGEGGEKTEEATPKKLNDARDEGQVAKSQDVNVAVLLLLMFICLKVFGGFVSNRMLGTFKMYYGSLSEYTSDFTKMRMMNLFVLGGREILLTAGPILALTVIAAFIVNVVQVKWHPTLKPLRPKFSKLNPVSGVKRLFSKDKVFELIKSVAKIAVLFYVVYSSLKDEWGLVINIYQLDLWPAVLLIVNTVISVGFKISVVFLILAVGDLYYQKKKFKKDMKMTKQEVKDEYKNAEGDPQVKGKIRSKMHEVSRRRMMQSVPEADVVITNPTHFAVAIKYDKSLGEAPVVLAKGADFLAEKIKDTARLNKVEIVENKPLARMLYYNVEIGSQIPPELYQMVAEVLAYVYSIQGKI